MVSKQLNFRKLLKFQKELYYLISDDWKSILIIKETKKQEGII